MTLELLESRIESAVSRASEHAQKCGDLVALSGLPAAIEYCQGTGIEPPKCSLTASSDNAQKLRDAATRKLADPKWWKQSLERQALQTYETEQIALGNVTNFVSDGVAAYMAKRKR